MQIENTSEYNALKNYKKRSYTACYILLINLIGISMHFLHLYETSIIEIGSYIFPCIIFTIVYCIWKRLEQHRTKFLTLFKIFNTAMLAFMLLIILYWHNVFFLKHDILTYSYNLDTTVFIVFFSIILRLIVPLTMKECDRNNDTSYKILIYFVLIVCLYIAIFLLFLITPFIMKIGPFYLLTLMWIYLRISAILLFSNLLIGDLLYPVYEGVKTNYFYFIVQLIVILLYTNRTLCVPDHIMLEQKPWYEWVMTMFLKK